MTNWKPVVVPPPDEIEGMEGGMLDTDRSYPVPTQIRRHPGVKEVLDAVAMGFDYKWNVFLKAGWEFESGRTAGTRTGNFSTWQAFHNARPIRVGGR